ncbi:MAG: hypothetical protein LBH13_06480 [Cellulomonadaceae bacterium]|jgi:hypothetical protein|nr:hypothetical protein [Cellulomonadaceae bacterium]
MTFQGKDYGCVMLNVEVQGIPEIPADWAYIDPDNPKDYGIPVQKHVTIKYGLIPELVSREDVLNLDSPECSHTVFGSFGLEWFGNSDDYAVAVLALKGADLQVLHRYNAELSTLPHIDTHPAYRPHVTLGYIKREYRHLVGRIITNEEVGRCSIVAKNIVISGLPARTSPTSKQEVNA